MASDTAKGPLAGYLFQFEKALLVISKLEDSKDYISVEEADDIATHEENGTIILTYQAKNSISATGTTFENTSRALWRTFEIWIEKLLTGIFDNNTKFICSTNKKIPNSSLLHQIKNENYSDVIDLINALLKEQEEKLKDILSKDPKKGKSVQQTIKSIKYILSNSSSFEIIAKNIDIEDEEVVKIKFLNQLHLSDSYSQDSKDSIFEEFYGWITLGSKSKWMNGDEARFTKKQFDDKFFLINNTSSIVNVIFRTKEVLGTISQEDIKKKKTELFVKQLEDIDRREDAKMRIIDDAILDFLYCDIETRYIIQKGNYTDKDFEKFLENCKDAWEKCFDENVIEELENYDDKQKNSMAIAIYTAVMDKLEIKFKNQHEFNPDNRYVRNGSFLKLSNIPTIGWHPEWKTKYEKQL